LPDNTEDTEKMTQ